MLVTALGRDAAPGRALLEAFGRLEAAPVSPSTPDAAPPSPSTPHAPASAATRSFERLLELLELRLEDPSGDEHLARLAEGTSERPEADPLELRQAVRLAAAAVRQLPIPRFDLSAPMDLLGDLFQNLTPPPDRRRLGEHYTPGWLAQRVLEPLEWTGAPGTCLLDPACGAGVFLLHALARCRKSRPEDGPEAWLETLRGIDIQPHAVRAARLNLRLALWDVSRNPPVDRCIQPGDALALQAGQPPLDRPITHLAANPPWIGWENLPEHQRGWALRLWDREGLFDQSGWRARMGAAKKDLAMLFVALAGSSWLAPGGRLGLVLPRSLATSAASSGLRRRIGEGLLELERLEDLSRLRVFAGTTAPLVLLVGRRPEGASTSGATAASSRRAASALAPPAVPPPATSPVLPAASPPASDPTHLPPSALALPPVPAPATSPALPLTASPGDTPAIPWIEWKPRPRMASAGTLEQVLTATTRQTLRLHLQPGSGAAWVPVDPAASSIPTPPDGPSAYRAYEGANTGGANGVFWLELMEPFSGPLVRIRNLPERGRQPLPRIEAEIETRYVWPLLRGREVSPWLARPSGHLLLVQDPATRRGYPLERLEREGPRTLGMLRQFELELAARPLFRKYFRPPKDAWYSIYNVGPYTVTPWKVVWRELGSRLTSAVVGPDALGRGVIPDHKLMLVACETPAEAHFLCAVLNSPPAGAVAQRLCLSTSVPTHVLQHLAVPRFDPGDAHHQVLSALSMAAHEARAGGREVDGRLEAHLTREVRRLWAVESAARKG